MIGWMNHLSLEGGAAPLDFSHDMSWLQLETLKSPFMRVKEESERASLKLNIKKTKIMSSGPITSWQIGGGNVEVVTYFLSLGSKITADGACSHEIRRRLLLGSKVKTNLDSVLKSRDVTLPTKVRIVKAIVFPADVSAEP